MTSTRSFLGSESLGIGISAIDHRELAAERSGLGCLRVGKL